MRALRTSLGRSHELLVLAAFSITLISPASLTAQAGVDKSSAPKPAQDALALLRRALAAQGGEEQLRAVKDVRWEMFGYRDMVEESERPEGPYLKEFDTVTQFDDGEHGRIRIVTNADVHPVFQFEQGSRATRDAAMTLAGGKWRAGTPNVLRTGQEQLALAPEQVLLTALSAPDAHIEADAVLHTEPQKVVGFSLDGALVRVYLNAQTMFLTAVDYSGPLARTGFWAFVGDVTMRTWYSEWWLCKGGVHLPMEWTIERNGLPDHMLVARAVSINSELNESNLAIPDEIRAAFKAKRNDTSPEQRPLGDPSEPAREIAHDVVLIPGGWNVSLIRQDDGIVVLEAPIASGYSAKVIEEARRRFPGVPIKAVITTSDAWPHLAGIREYVAQGIPIYALDLDRPILERTVRASHTQQPDSLQNSPREPVFHWIYDGFRLDSHENPLEIIPLSGPTTVRQLMVYFPQQKLLYGSDAFQINPDGTYNLPQTVDEVLQAVDREHLDVSRYFMMHVLPAPWASLASVTAAAHTADSPQEAR